MVNRAKKFITVLLLYFWYPDFPVPTPGEDTNKKAIVGVRGYPLSLYLPPLVIASVLFAQFVSC